MRYLILILLILTSCTSLEVHRGVCRHRALYVASVLVEHYPDTRIHLTQINRNLAHAQVFADGAWWELWNNEIVYETRQEYHKTVKVLTLQEYVQMLWGKYDRISILETLDAKPTACPPGFGSNRCIVPLSVHEP